MIVIFKVVAKSDKHRIETRKISSYVANPTLVVHEQETTLDG